METTGAWEVEERPADGAGCAARTGRRACVVGDVIGYTALVEHSGAASAGRAMEGLFSSLLLLLAEYGGKLEACAGDSVFATWDATLNDEEAASLAVRYAQAARALADSVGERLPVRTPGGSPIRMGWAVTLGSVAICRAPGAPEMLHGDAINVAFRLSGMAGRAGRAAVLVTAEAAAAAPGAARYLRPAAVRVRGRSAPALVYEGAWAGSLDQWLRKASISSDLSIFERPSIPISRARSWSSSFV